MVRIIVHTNNTIDWYIQEQIFFQPLWKIVKIHQTMVVAWSGSRFDYQACPYTKPSSLPAYTLINWLLLLIYFLEYAQVFPSCQHFLIHLLLSIYVSSKYIIDLLLFQCCLISCKYLYLQCTISWFSLLIFLLSSQHFHQNSILCIILWDVSFFQGNSVFSFIADNSHILTFIELIYCFMNYTKIKVTFKNAFWFFFFFLDFLCLPADCRNGESIASFLVRPIVCTVTPVSGAMFF